MGNVINLGRARKRKQQQAKERQADANAIAHGRTKGDKQRDRLERARQQARLDGARLGGTTADEPDADAATDDEPDADAASDDED